MSHGTETFVGETFSFSLFSGIEKLIHKSYMSRFCVEKFLFLITENFFRGTILCLRKFLVWKKFMVEKGVSRLSVGNFLSQIAEKQRGRTLLCFRFVLVSNFLDSRGITNLPIVFVSRSQQTLWRTL